MQREQRNGRGQSWNEWKRNSKPGSSKRNAWNCCHRQNASGRNKSSSGVKNGYSKWNRNGQNAGPVGKRAPLAKLWGIAYQRHRLNLKGKGSQPRHLSQRHSLNGALCHSTQWALNANGRQLKRQENSGKTPARNSLATNPMHG